MSSKAVGLHWRDMPACLEEGRCPVQFLEGTGSTNHVAKEWAQAGAPHGALVLARRQTAGRGRLGKSFSSPAGGIYASMVLRPGQEGRATTALITAAAAVAVHRAVRQVCGLMLGIKWVNDLYCGKKKCCGILAESEICPQTGQASYIVLGIGLNYDTPASELANITPPVVSLYPQADAPVPAAHLAVAIHREVMHLAAQLPDISFLQEYRLHNIVLGRQVLVLDTPPWPALALEIDDSASLLVRREDGQIKTLSFGEIGIMRYAE